MRQIPEKSRRTFIDETLENMRQGFIDLEEDINIEEFKNLLDEHCVEIMRRKKAKSAGDKE